MDRYVSNADVFLPLVNELALDEAEDEDPSAYVRFLNFWLCFAGQKEKVIVTGSSLEGTKIRLGEVAGDVDLMLVSGKGVISKSCMEFLPKCPAFLCINGTRLPKDFKSMQLIDRTYLPSSILKDLHKQVFGILRGIINLQMTSSVSTDGEISFFKQSSVGKEKNVLTGINPESLGLTPLSRDSDKTIDTMGRTMSELFRKMEVKCGRKQKHKEMSSAYDKFVGDFLEGTKELIKCGKHNVPLSILHFVGKSAFDFYNNTRQPILSSEESETDSEVEPTTEEEKEEEDEEESRQVPSEPNVCIDELLLKRDSIYRAEIRGKEHDRVAHGQQKIDLDLSETERYSKLNSGSNDTDSSSEDEEHSSIYFNDLDESSELEDMDLSDKFLKNTENFLPFESSSRNTGSKNESKERVKGATEPVVQLRHDVNPSPDSHDSRINAFYKKMSSTDFVPAFKCSGWPSPSDEWITRPRLWPSERLVREILQCGFHVVAKAPPACAVLHDDNFTEDKYFRLSFSTAEIMLFQNMSTSQRQCLRVLKAYQKGMLQTDVKILTSYHWKTTLLWLSEKKEPSFWTETNLMSSVMEALNDMVGYLSRQSLPHYFVPEMNLLIGCNRDECKVVLAQIKCIGEDPVEALRKCITQSQTSEKHILFSSENIEKLRQISQETDGSSVMNVFKEDVGEAFIDGMVSGEWNPFSACTFSRGLNLAFEEIQTIAKQQLMKRDISQAKIETMSKMLGDVSSCLSNILPEDSTTGANRRTNKGSTEDSGRDHEEDNKMNDFGKNFTSLLGTFASVMFSSDSKNSPTSFTPRNASKEAHNEDSDIELD